MFGNCSGSGDGRAVGGKWSTGSTSEPLYLSLHVDVKHVDTYNSYFKRAGVEYICIFHVARNRTDSAGSNASDG